MTIEQTINRHAESQDGIIGFIVETTLHTTGGAKPGRPGQVFFKQQERWWTWMIRSVQYTCMEQRLSQIITREN